MWRYSKVFHGGCSINCFRELISRSSTSMLFFFFFFFSENWNMFVFKISLLLFYGGKKGKTVTHSKSWYTALARVTKNIFGWQTQRHWFNQSILNGWSGHLKHTTPFFPSLIINFFKVNLSPSWKVLKVDVEHSKSFLWLVCFKI